MSFDYAELATDALELLTEFGREVTRRYVTAGTYDPALGSAAITTVDTARKGATFDFNAGQTQVRGTLIQKSDKRLLLDAIGGIDSQDSFVIDGVAYGIISFAEINPAGTPVLYDIHVRR